MTHASPTIEARRAKAPYNFVRLPETIAIPDDAPEYDQSKFTGLSGYIDLEFTTLSPLYVRGMLTPSQYKQFGKVKVADLPPERQQEYFETIAKFFEYNNTLTVPGSSLRGMFRTLVEVASYSKIPNVTDNKMMYRSVDSTSHGDRYRQRFYDEVDANDRISLTPKFKTGYLFQENYNWYIRPSVTISGTGFAKVSHVNLANAKVYYPRRNPEIKIIDVHFLPQQYDFHHIHGRLYTKTMWVERVSKTAFTGSRPGKLIISGPMGRKKSETIIFEENTAQEKMLVPQELVDLYLKEGVPYYQTNRPMLGDTGLLQPGQRFPVYYLCENDKVVTFSHCSMARIPYLNSPYDLVPKEAEESHPDLAERLFGYVSKKKDATDARAGRIFFEDAVILTNPGQLTPKIPKILNNPKPTTFQHYLNQHSENKKDLLDYDSKETQIRGFKFYWSKGSDPEYIDQDLQMPDRMHTMIAPVPAGNSFKSRIRFENLTEHELGCVLWVIALGAEEENCLRIGMAKPYGLGAVRIKEHTLSLIDRKKRYDKIQVADTIDLNVNPLCEKSNSIETYINAFKDWITRTQKNGPFDKLERIKELKILHRWFKDSNDKFEYMSIGDFRDRKVLPNALDVLSLPIAKQGQGGHQKGQGKGQYKPTPKPKPNPVSKVQPDYAGAQIFVKITGQDEKGNYLCQTDKGQFKGKTLVILNDIKDRKPKVGQIWKCKITPDNLTVDEAGRIGVIGLFRSK
jgi:CRISPR-associated protein (TIGR03986 family)